MKAVVLVGGRGTRLLPLTATVPKQLLPVAGVRMLDRALDAIGDIGVDEAVLSMGYQPDAFRAAYPDGQHRGIKIGYATEPTPLDTAGGIAFAARAAGVTDTFLVLNSDVLHQFDVGEVIAFHRKTGAEATVALTPVADPSDFGVVVADADGRVEAFLEKPGASAPSNLINAGIYVFEPSVVDRIPAEVPVHLEGVVFPAMSAAGTLYAIECDGWWIDIGTRERYLQANADLLGGVSLVDEAATVATSADIRASCVAARARVGDEALVEESVVLEGARIGDGAQLRRSIVGPGAVVADGAVVDDDIVVTEGGA